MTDHNIENDEIDIPIEAEEQAQLLEMKFRMQALEKMRGHYIKLDGISTPADVVEDLECEQCGAPVPKGRVLALMAEFQTATGTEWKADPNALICVECATANEKRSRMYGSSN